MKQTYCAFILQKKKGKMINAQPFVEAAESFD